MTKYLLFKQAYALRNRLYVGEKIMEEGELSDDCQKEAS